MTTPTTYEQIVATANRLRGLQSQVGLPLLEQGELLLEELGSRVHEGGVVVLPRVPTSDVWKALRRVNEAAAKLDKTCKCKPTNTPEHQVHALISAIRDLVEAEHRLREDAEAC